MLCADTQEPQGVHATLLLETHCQAEAKAPEAQTQLVEADLVLGLRVLLNMWARCGKNFWISFTEYVFG